MAPTPAPRVYVDFQNADPKGRVRLNCAGTTEDLTRHNVVLREGLVLELYSDDADDGGQPDELRVRGTVEYSTEERDWVAVVDWAALGHASDGAAPPLGRKAL